MIEENPDAGRITIIEYSDEKRESDGVRPMSVRGYSDVKKTWSEYGVEVEDVFVTSVAKGQTKTLGTTWSHTLNCDITGGIDQVSLGIKASITKSYSVTDQFQGPPETGTNNSREYRVKFYENRGSYTALAHDDFPGFIIKVPISGEFTEPEKFLAYSIDLTVSAR